MLVAVEVQDGRGRKRYVRGFYRCCNFQQIHAASTLRIAEMLGAKK